MKRIETVFVVDDDPITVFGIRKMLDSLGLCENIITHSNGKKALDGIRERIASNLDVPDVIFLDINMPVMDGWQFLEEFFAIPVQKTVRINVLTSSIDPLDRQNWEKYRVRTHHYIDFINKPLRFKDIEEITRAA